MAIVISGDGGWRDLDKTIAEDLQRDGVPVVGWDSLRYFWSKKTPQQTANDLAAVMRTYMAKWHAERGRADRLFVRRRRDAVRIQPPAGAICARTCVLIALLGFSKTADFEITVSGWMGEPPGPKAMPVVPETDKIPPSLMQCFYGRG